MEHIISYIFIFVMEAIILLQYSSHSIPVACFPRSIPFQADLQY